MPSSGELVDVPRSSVVIAGDDAVDVSATDAPAVAGRLGLRLQFCVFSPADLGKLTTFLVTCFGDRLTSLAVNIVVGATSSDYSVASILAAFPLLECLKLSPTQLKTMDVFLDAYRNGRCRLRIRSITSGGIGFEPFFEELASPDAVIARRLEQLKFNYPDGEAPDVDGFLRALTTMLTYNNVLRVLKLVVPTKSEQVIEKISSVLRPLQSRAISVASRSGMPLNAKIAILGAVTGESCDRGRPAKQPRTTATVERSASGSRPRHCLDRGALELILAFAAPCEKRLIRLVHESYRGVCYGKATGGCRTFESVNQEVIAL